MGSDSRYKWVRGNPAEFGCLPHCTLFPRARRTIGFLQRVTRGDCKLRIFPCQAIDVVALLYAFPRARNGTTVSAHRCGVLRVNVWTGNVSSMSVTPAAGDARIGAEDIEPLTDMLVERSRDKALRLNCDSRDTVACVNVYMTDGDGHAMTVACELAEALISFIGGRARDNGVHCGIPVAVIIRHECQDSFMVEVRCDDSTTAGSFISTLDAAFVGTEDSDPRGSHLSAQVPFWGSSD